LDEDADSNYDNYSDEETSSLQKGLEVRILTKKSKDHEKEFKWLRM
jgi:hypothetical protein